MMPEDPSFVHPLSCKDLITHYFSHLHARWIVPYSRIIFSLRERFDSQESLTKGDFCKLLESDALKDDEEDALEHLLRKLGLHGGVTGEGGEIEGHQGGGEEGERIKVSALISRLELLMATESTSEHLSRTSPSLHSSNRILLASAATNAASLPNPWQRTISQISLATGRSSMAEFEAPCQLSSIVKMLGRRGLFLLDRHIEYAVELYEESTLKSTVTRRYRDFEWLRRLLLCKYPFRLIPILPPKDLLVQFSDRSVSSRLEGLNIFVRLLLQHSILRRDPVCQAFFQEKDFEQFRRSLPSRLDEEFLLTPNSNSNNNNNNGNNDDGSAPNNQEDGGGEDLGGETLEIKLRDCATWASAISQILRDLALSLSTILEDEWNISCQMGKLVDCCRLLSNQFPISHQSLTALEHFKEAFSIVSNKLNGQSPQLSDISAQISIHLILFQSVLDMVDRITRCKYSQFMELADRLVALQAQLQKIRCDPTGGAPEEADRIVTRIADMQRQYLYHRMRNGFAESCLGREIGWTTRMAQGLSSLFQQYQSIKGNLYAECSHALTIPTANLQI